MMETLFYFIMDQCISRTIWILEDVFSQFHDGPIHGHPGISETTTQIQREYYWPGMRSFIHYYINGCGICQQFKYIRRRNIPTIISIPSSSSQPFAQVSMDFLTNLPTTPDGFDSIMVMVDHGLSKGLILKECNKTINAFQTATIIFQEIIRRFGLPDKLISDRGPQFASAVFQEVIKLKNMQCQQPTTHKQTEQLNDICKKLKLIFQFTVFRTRLHGKNP